MAIADTDEKDLDQPKPVIPKHDYITQEAMQTSLLFNKEVGIDIISSEIKGMKWEIDYFNQVRSVNDSVSNADIRSPSTIHKYHRIDKLILFVQNPITQDNLENVSGEASINAGIFPNTGDVFIATIGGRRDVMFVVTNVTTKSYNIHPIYTIEYKLFATLDTNPDVYNDILNKVIQEYVYDKNFLLDNSAPVITKKEYTRKVNIKESLKLMTEYYLKTFLNPRYRYLAPPTTDNSVCVDIFVNEFLYKIIDLSRFPDNLRIRHLSRLLEHENTYTLWDAILRRDMSYITMDNNNMRFRHYTMSSTDLRTLPLYALGVNYTVTDEEIPPIVPQTKVLGNGSMADIDVANTYALSNEFYNGQFDMMDDIEKALYRFMENKLIYLETAELFISTYKTWPTMKQFYHIPIAILLLSDSVKNTYKSI